MLQCRAALKMSLIFISASTPEMSGGDPDGIRTVYFCDLLTKADSRFSEGITQVV